MKVKLPPLISISFLVGTSIVCAQEKKMIIKDTVTKTKKIEEVVLIGFGSTKRKNVTGAISSVKMTDINTSTNSNVMQAMAGRVAGVTTMSTTGQPGASTSVLIRSSASFASSGPLYIVDGVIINDSAGEPGSGTRYGNSGISRSTLNFLNPNDVESIDILKDASATAIYGARAAGGVVLITTKKGKSGKPTIQYDFSNAFQQSIKYYELMNTQDYMLQRNKILYEKWMLDNKIGIYGGKDPSSAPAFTPKYMPEQINSQPSHQSAIDAIMQPGLTEQHNISISGAVDKTRYYVSGNYLNQVGVLKHSDFKNFSGKLSVDQGIGNSFKIGVSVIANGSKSNNGNIGSGVFENSGMIGSAVYHPPTLPLKDVNNNYTINPDYQNTPNPLSFLEITDYSQSNRLFTSGYTEWTIIPGLLAKGTITYDQSSSKRYTYLPRTFLYGARSEGQASISENNSNTLSIDYTLNYTKNLWEKHKINLLIGHSYQIIKQDGFSAGNDHFPTDNFLFNNLGLGTAQRPVVNSYRSPERVWKSYFARFTYEFEGKYILSASIRRDGASHFAENKKWGVFPGVSTAWVMSEENFLKDSKILNLLKLRLGYGEVGNSNIGSSAFTYYGSGSSFVFGGDVFPGVKISQLANPNLTWETQTEKNIGLDIGILNNRVTGSFDYYQRIFKNLLSNISLSTDFPVSSVATNAGRTKSAGFEFGLQSKNIINPDGFNWSSTFNFTHFKNKWVERSNDALKTLGKYINPTGNFNDTYGYISDGIYDPAKKSAPSWMPGILPGEVIIKDINGYDENGNLLGRPDGKLNSADITVIMSNPSTAPRFTFGFGNEFRYKNFDLTIYAYAAIQKKFNTDYQTNSKVYGNLGAFGWNMLDIAKNRWAFDHRETSIPTGLNGNYSNYSNNSDYWVEDASFIRVRDITLGYKLSQDLLEKLKVVKSVRFYFSIQNPFIITKYKGVDPELQNFYSYPITKSFILGANISF
ncbi:SusC/RagA family TonB-linked outer membrane protein [Elizabethkingia anophelis]|uniref:SusC/RagA family TonB-linked outer membrane protein n=1 Tax=Elizabethkingia anophelis TaxID=1117645 RepID=UPI0038919F0D